MEAGLPVQELQGRVHERLLLLRCGRLAEEFVEIVVGQVGDALEAAGEAAVVGILADGTNRWRTLALRERHQVYDRAVLLMLERDTRRERRVVAEDVGGGGDVMESASEADGGRAVELT